MATFKRSNIGEVLPLLQTQLANSLSFPPERVLMRKHATDSLKPATLQADQYVVIRPEEEVAIRPQITSAGRHDGRYNRRVTVVAWSRLNIDYANQDYSWLTDPNLGELQLEKAIMNALLTWIPINGNNDVLAIPGRVEQITAPVGDYPEDWGHSDFSIVYQMYRNVNQAVIFPGAQ
jgi:hypothetical protein